MARNDTVLVLGATGGIGGEVARQLHDAGWEVRALKRDAQEGKREGITWMPDLATSGRRYLLRAVDDQGRAESRELTVDIAP